MNTIPYFDPVQQRQRRYFIDFVMWVKVGPNVLQEIWVEIKSSAETVPPKKGRNSILYNESLRTYATNLAKWRTA